MTLSRKTNQLDEQDFEILTEEDKRKAISNLRKDMVKYFDLQVDIKRMIKLLTRIGIISALIAVMGIGIVIYLIIRPKPAAEVTLDHVEQEQKNVSLQKQLNNMDREDIAKARSEIQKMVYDLKFIDSVNRKKYDTLQKVHNKSK